MTNRITFFADDDTLKYIRELEEKLANAQKNADRFNYLQNIDPKDAQAFFWNFNSRRQRAAAIDASIAKEAERG